MSNPLILKRLQDETEKNGFVKLLGIEFTDADEGYCKGEMLMEPRYGNQMGTPHGGTLYALADTVAGMAAASCGLIGPTLSGNMYFLRPLADSKKLICEGRVIKNGKRIRVVEAYVYGDNGVEAARCTFEYMDVGRNLIL